MKNIKSNKAKQQVAGVNFSDKLFSPKELKNLFEDVQKEIREISERTKIDYEKLKIIIKL